MWIVFLRAIKDRRLITLIYILGIVAFLWMYVGLFPAMKDQSASMEALIKNYPESFLKAFNFDIKNFTTLEGFISTEQFSFVWPIIIMFMTIGFAGGAFAGEIEKGTIEIILAQPISRAKIFWSRYLAGLLLLAIFTAASIYATIPLAKVYNLTYIGENYSTMFVLALLFSSAAYSLAMFFSSIFSDKGKVFFITGSIFVVMYVLNILSAIKDNLNDLKYFSFFYYFNPAKALIYNDIDHWSYLVFGGVILLSTIIGMIWFIRRDAVS